MLYEVITRIPQGHSRVGRDRSARCQCWRCARLAPCRYGYGGLSKVGTRITSYNVCYTKLLRHRGGGFFRKIRIGFPADVLLVGGTVSEPRHRLPSSRVNVTVGYEEPCLHKTPPERGGFRMAAIRRRYPPPSASPRRRRPRLFP